MKRLRKSRPMMTEDLRVGDWWRGPDGINVCIQAITEGDILCVSPDPEQTETEFFTALRTRGVPLRSLFDLPRRTA